MHSAPSSGQSASALLELCRGHCCCLIAFRDLTSSGMARLLDADGQEATVGKSQADSSCCAESVPLHATMPCSTRDTGWTATILCPLRT